MVYLRELIDSLTNIAEDHNDVRIVLWFNN